MAQYIKLSLKEFMYLKTKKDYVEAHFHISIVVPDEYNEIITVAAICDYDFQEVQSLRDFIKFESEKEFPVLEEHTIDNRPDNVQDTVQKSEHEHTQDTELPRDDSDQPKSKQIKLMQGIDCSNPSQSQTTAGVNPEILQLRQQLELERGLRLEMGLQITRMERRLEGSSKAKHVDHGDTEHKRIIKWPITISMLKSAMKTVSSFLNFDRAQETNSSNSNLPGERGSGVGQAVAPVKLDGKTVTKIPKPLGVQLRHIVVDGSNVARKHGIIQRTFSSRGIDICVKYFLARGHKDVTVFIPEKDTPTTIRGVQITDGYLLDDLERSGHLIYTPLKAYDDLFILNLATDTDGVIVSNDNFKDIFTQKFKKTITYRLLKFCFIRDFFMVPGDPLGKDGIRLKEFLEK